MNKTIILVGNPNVGKSVVFAHLTGRYAVVSNYPGTTVDISRGVALFAGTTYQVLDTPGTGSLVPVSEDEQVTRDVLFREKSAVIVQVADAKNLQRTLLLTLELMELGLPMMLVLNMVDEARERGIYVDCPRLEKELGVPVVPTTAVTGEGMAGLKKRIPDARTGSAQACFRQDLEDLIKKIGALMPASFPFRRSLALMLLSGDESARAYVPEQQRETVRRIVADALPSFAVSPRRIAFNRYNGAAERIVTEVQRRTGKPGGTWMMLFGDLTMRPFPGYLIAAGAVVVMYYFVGVFAAGTIVDFMQNIVFGRYVNPVVMRLVEDSLGSGFLRDFLVGPYGVITMALTYAIAIVFPIVSAFFFFFGFLEDSGYLPRLSVMLDRAFRAFGLNGKAVIPMVLGLGCGTMATMSSRILETKKERLITVLLLSLAIPCSAQLGVILALLAGLSWRVSVLWFSSVVFSLLLIGGLSNRILPGSQSPFILEIPPLRVPSFANILIKIRVRLVWYMREAVPLFVLGTALLFVLDKTGGLGMIEAASRPLATGILGLPATVTKMFILGFLRRDYGAAGLFDMARAGLLDPTQIVVSVIAVTLFVPCVAQCLIVVKEQGVKRASAMMAFVAVYALLFSGLVNLLIRSLHLL